MLGLLATGGMAEVYLALSGELHGFRTLVVVKRILPHLASDRDFIRMFFDEASIVALLDHPNIVRIIEVGQDRDEYFLAMDLVQGKPLSAVIRKSLKQGTPLTQTQSAFLVAQAANGLGHAHGLVDTAGLPLNIVHRDVSPQNILVSYAGAVKVIDFGVASMMGRVSATRPGGLKGKIQYMAPEQAASGRVDRRSDVFALGVVLWEAICGRRPFRRETEIETLRAVVEEPIPPPSKFVRIPARLESIVMRALDRNPANRFQTAQEMALSLERYAFASPDFNPAQISTVMKTLFASDVTRWKKTVSTVKAMEGEPEQWVNTSGTYLHPEAIDLATRGDTVALHPVPHTPRPLISTQELPSTSPSLPSIGFSPSGPLRLKLKRRRRAIGGAAVLGAVTLVVGLLVTLNTHPTASTVRLLRGEPPPTRMRVEALPRPSPPTVTPTAATPGPPVALPASAPMPSGPASNPEALDEGPRAPKTLPSTTPDSTLSVAAADDAPSGVRTTADQVARVKPHQSSSPPPSSSRSRTATAAVAANKTPANARRCLIRVGTKPWSEIWIDGQNTKLHTPYVGDVACGEHTLTFKRPDLHLLKRFRVTAFAGDTLTQSFSLTDD